MNKLTTHKGDTLLLIECPANLKKAWIYRECISDGKLETRIGNDSSWITWFKKLDGDYLDYTLIGTTSTLTDEQVKELIKDFTFTKGVSGDNWYKCDTLNEFLEVNNIDTTKNWVVLKLKND